MALNTHLQHWTPKFKVLTWTWGLQLGTLQIQLIIRKLFSLECAIEYEKYPQLQSLNFNRFRNDDGNSAKYSYYITRHSTGLSTLLLCNTYFTSVYPAALRLQRNRPFTGGERSYKARDGYGIIYHTVFAIGFDTRSVATYWTLRHGFSFIRLSRPGGC